MSDPVFVTQVRRARLARGLSQADLARQAGLSRSGVSALESGRLVPSVAAALRLAGVLGCGVEDLFRVESSAAGALQWAEPPAAPTQRFWVATVGGRPWAYAVHEASEGPGWHDGLWRKGAFSEVDRQTADQTLVVASCDPAAPLMASELSRSSPFRVVVLRRSSREALQLLAQGLVHLAGIHFSAQGTRDANRAQVRRMLGKGYRLLRVARWDEGLAVAPSVRQTTAAALVEARVRWIGRQPGSGARACLDQLLGSRAAPRRTARDHREVARAIARGWADVGVCVRLACEEQGLPFVAVRQEDYELCCSSQYEKDPRVAALVGLLRTERLRRLMGELPGYDCRHMGRMRSV